MSSPANFDWELKKENVIPLKTGRTVATLTTALAQSAHSEQRLEELTSERSEFERALRDTESDDPMEMWEKYISWTKQNYVGDEEGSGLFELLERCVREFKDDECWHNDIRYLRVWLDYASKCLEPQAIFTYLYTNNLCTSHAALYEAWASVLEEAGQYSRADKVYQAGINKRAARPLDRLRRRYADFQHRLADKIRQDAERGDLPTPAERGQAVPELPRQQPRSRLLDASARPLAQAQAMRSARPNVSRPAFTVYEDSQGAPATASRDVVPAGSAQAPFPQPRTQHKENRQLPTTWTDVSAVQPQNSERCAPVPTRPAFEIFEDEPDANASSATATGSSSSSVRHRLEGALAPSTKTQSAVRVNPLAGVKAGVTTMRHAVTNEARSYDPQVLFPSSNVEYCFEELRAMEMLARQQQAAREAALAAEIEAEAQRVLELEQEELAAQQAEEARLARTDAEDAIRARAAATLQKAVQSCMSDDDDESMATIPVNALVRQINFDPSTPGGGDTLTLEVPCGAIRAAAAAVSAAAEAASVNAPASPTINMKAALADINSMFTAPLDDHDNNDGCDDEADYYEDDGETTRIIMAARQQMAQAEPICFSVYEDDGADNATSNVQFSSSSSSPQRPTHLRLSLDRTIADNASPQQSQRHVPDDENTPPPGSPSPERLAHSFAMSRAALQSLDEFPVEQEEEEEEEDNEFDDNNNDDGSVMAAPTTTSADDFVVFEDTNVTTDQSANLSVTAPFAQSTPFAIFSDENAVPSLAEQQSFIAATPVAVVLPPSAAPVVATPTPASTHQQLSPIMETSVEDSHGNSSFGSSVNTSLVSSASDAVDNGTSDSIDDTTLDIPCNNQSRRDELASGDEDQSDDEPNPFLASTIKKTLTLVDSHLGASSLYHTVTTPGPLFERASRGDTLSLDVTHSVRFDRLLGSGAFASVYLVERVDDDDDDEEGVDQGVGGGRRGMPALLAAKVETPACPWEFYALSALHERVNTRTWFVQMHGTYVYNEGQSSVLLLDYHEQPTLLKALNLYSQTGRELEETLVIFYTIELLKMCREMHLAGILHGDIKPDNLLLRSDVAPEMDGTGDDVTLGSGLSNEWERTWRADGEGGWRLRGLRLVDFGRAIDLRQYPEGQRFSGKSETSSFKCVPMQTGESWRYECDTYGLLGTVHTLLHRSYMQVEKNPETGRWQPQLKWKRYWQRDLWEQLFDTLLNGEGTPDVLAAQQSLFENYLETNAMRAKTIKSLLCRQDIMIFEGGHK